jgi:methylenetetrahydrofolate dehydrogenase (NADP+)/methenyltetrahydrofolate cyclohydrolase
MTARLIDGKALAAKLRAEVAREVGDMLRTVGARPRLDVVLVGDDPASRAYVGTKTRMAAEVGIDGRLHALPAETRQADLLGLLDRLNADDEVDGILVQLPLPRHLDAGVIPERLDPAKDVDGFHPLNAGRLATGCWPAGAARLIPCTPQGCMLLLREVLGGNGLRGKRAIVVGRSSIVGRPMALLLLAADCTVTVAHSRTADLEEACLAADIVVAAVGRPGLIRGDWLRPGSVVIDVGINRVTEDDGTRRLVGDVAFGEAVGRAAAITPVPGGVGPMTVACLLLNTLRAAQARRGLRLPPR